MFKYHAETKHSYLSVRRGGHRLDWSMQPSPYKRYPEHLPRFAFDKGDEEDIFLYHIGGINAKKSYPAVCYYLRMNPAAGALYPNELYLQIRGVEGKQDGIYHYEVASSSLTLLYGLKDGEGIEPLVGEKRAVKGYLFLVSMIPWRSAWKYRDRAFRYCLLDGGHLLGGVEMAALLKPHATRFIYDIDREALNHFFHFKEQEFFISAAVVGVPMRERYDLAVPEVILPYVDATDTFSPTPLIDRAYEESSILQKCHKNHKATHFEYEKSRLQEAIFRRRSCRAFEAQAVTKGALNYIESVLSQPVMSDCDEAVDIYIVINRVVDMPCGIRLDGAYIKYGDFSKKTGYLALEQYHLASDGALVFIMVSRGKNYQALYQKAGIIGQRLYIASEYLGLGCSGIGAYYDDKVCEFLEIDKGENMVLYMMAVGRCLQEN